MSGSIRVVQSSEDTCRRIEKYMDEHFNTSINHYTETWIAEAFKHKEELAKMLGLPDPASGLLFESDAFQLDDSSRQCFRNMIAAAEGIDQHLISWNDFDLNLGNLTYRMGESKKDKKLLRQLRKAPLERQQPAFINLLTLIHHTDGYNTNPDGSFPFEKFWAKIGDITNAKYNLLITPDPIMTLGSGLFKNTGSCHRPGGEYMKGPFTYAYDEHTITAFVFSSSDIKNATDDMILTPYTSDLWMSGESNDYCCRALGRTLYHIQDPSREDSLAYFVQARAYGIMNSGLQKDIRHVIEQRLREYKGIPPNIWKSLSSDSVRVYLPSITYGDSDTYVGKYIALDDDRNPIQMDVLPTIEFNEPPCLLCAESEISRCDSCITTMTCCNCGCGISDGDSISNMDGYNYCEECFYELYTYCDSCEEYCDKDDACAVEVGGTHGNYDEYWCPHCVDRYTLTCDSCGVIVPENSTVNTITFLQDSDMKVCQNCYEEMAGQCERCEGDFEYCHLNHDEHDDRMYCDECLEEVEKEREEEDDVDDETEVEVESETPLDTSVVTVENTSSTTTYATTFTYETWFDRNAHRVVRNE